MKVFALISFLTASLCVGTIVTAAQPPGEALYDRHCSKCHGAKGSGTDKGPPLVHMIYHPNHHGDMAFYFAVERGVVSHHWRFGDMPKIPGLKEDDAGNIIQYIRRLQKEAGIF